MSGLSRQLVTAILLATLVPLSLGENTTEPIATEATGNDTETRWGGWGDSQAGGPVWFGNQNNGFAQPNNPGAAMPRPPNRPGNIQNQGNSASRPANRPAGTSNRPTANANKPPTGTNSRPSTGGNSRPSTGTNSRPGSSRPAAKPTKPSSKPNGANRVPVVKPLPGKQSGYMVYEDLSNDIPNPLKSGPWFGSENPLPRGRIGFTRFGDITPQDRPYVVNRSQRRPIRQAPDIASWGFPSPGNQNGLGQGRQLQNSFGGGGFSQGFRPPGFGQGFGQSIPQQSFEQFNQDGGFSQSFRPPGGQNGFGPGNGFSQGSFGQVLPEQFNAGQANQGEGFSQSFRPPGRENGFERPNGFGQGQNGPRPGRPNGFGQGGLAQNGFGQDLQDQNGFSQGQNGFPPGRPNSVDQNNPGRPNGFLQGRPNGLEQDGQNHSQGPPIQFGQTIRPPRPGGFNPDGSPNWGFETTEESGLLFPNNGGERPGQTSTRRTTTTTRRPPTTRRTTTRRTTSTGDATDDTSTGAPGPTTTTMNPCERACPVTPEFNPVCTTDGDSYTNPGRLKCAQNCGKRITLSHYGSCAVARTTRAPLTLG